MAPLPVPVQTPDVLESAAQLHAPVPLPPAKETLKLLEPKTIAFPPFAVSVIAAWSIPVMVIVLAGPADPARKAPTAFAAAAIRHVPALTVVTTPVTELTVQYVVVRELYV